MSPLEKLCLDKQVKITCRYGEAEVPKGWASGTHPYKAILRYQGRQLTTKFFCGPAHTREPSAADVISCLCMDTPAGELSFEEFCDELGYNPDSRKSEKTWKDCAAMSPKVRRLLGSDFDLFASTEH